jgi:hypothetical protein
MYGSADMTKNKSRKIVFILFSMLSLFLLVCSPVSAANSTSWILLDSGTSDNLNSIWGTGSNAVFIAGENGNILRYDNSTWKPMDSNTIKDLYAIWGTSISNIFTAGESGIILHYDEENWTPMSSGTSVDLYAIWGTSKNDVFAVGSSGTILHYNGTNWSGMNSGTTNDLSAIWGSAGNDVFAVGKSGTILHYNGSLWSPQSSGITTDLNSVGGTSASSVFTAGKSGTILHYDGSLWTSMSSGTNRDLYGVWGYAETNVFVVGELGIITRYNGSEWKSMSRNTLEKLNTVWGFSPIDIFCAGESGVIQRYIPPEITSLSIKEGDQGARLEVTIKGNNLSETSQISFGAGIAVNSFTILNSTQITANITIVSGATTGLRSVSINTPGGSFVLPDSFTVKQSTPSITSISPNQARQAETVNITLNGTNLAGTGAVNLGEGIAVNNLILFSSNQISVNITIAADTLAGPRDVSVTTPGGDFTFPAGFTVKQALPIISTLNPNQSNQNVTTDIIIEGSNFSGTGEVRFGADITINTFSILSSNQISANISIAAEAQTGSRDITVSTPGGSFVLPAGFMVKQALPVISSINPALGSQGATLDVIITGFNFAKASEIRIGTGVAINRFTVLSPTQISANITIISGTGTGTRDVSVTTPGGSTALANGFIIKQAMPAVTSVSPNEASKGETLDIIISGSNFDGVTAISLGSGVTVKSITSLSPIQLKANIKIDDEAVTGVRSVNVTTPGGTSTLGNSFTIQEKALSTLMVVLIWLGIVIVIVLFVVILNLLRKKNPLKSG